MLVLSRIQNLSTGSLPRQNGIDDGRLLDAQRGGQGIQGAQSRGVIVAAARDAQGEAEGAFVLFDGPCGFE